MPLTMVLEIGIEPAERDTRKRNFGSRMQALSIRGGGQQATPVESMAHLLRKGATMPDLGTPEQWQETVTTVRDGVEAARRAFELVKRYCGAGQKATQEDEEETEKAIAEAEAAALIADANIAKALGYLICRCQFPPTAMLTVGQHHGRGREGPVYECPRCKSNNAGGWSYKRLVP